MSDTPQSGNSAVQPTIANARLASNRIARFCSQFTVAQPDHLTYTSSVDSACQFAGLQSYDMKVRGKKTAWRYIYTTADFLAWVPIMGGLGGGGMALATTDSEADPPKIQLDTELHGFCDGLGLAYGTDTKRLHPIEHGVWELKTSDLRLFGWFAAKNYFILHAGAFKVALKKFDDYAPYIEQVVECRKKFQDLPGPVLGGVADVISNRPRPV